MLLRYPRTVDAVVAFHSLVPTAVSYSIRTNHTSVSRAGAEERHDQRPSDNVHCFATAEPLTGHASVLLWTC